MTLTKDEALQEIGTQIAWWLRYEREARDGGAVSMDAHVIPPCWPSYGQLCNWLDYLAPALAIEARRAATGNTDAVEDESAGPQDNAQTTPGGSYDKQYQ